MSLVGTGQEDNMSVLELQEGVIYGPVNSRRLGRSLGINLLPARRKVCTFNCVYCQYGKAEAVSPSDVQAGFPSVSSVLQEVEEAIKRQQAPPDYLTFSGNGEPTLHPGFPEIVVEVLHLRDRLCPAARVAILSNSSTVHRPEVRRAIEQLDDPIMKLDAGDPETLSRLNRPARAVTLERILEGLAAMPRLIVQSMIIAGEAQNAEGEAHEAWLTTLCRLSPEKVQIYTAERPAAESGVRRVPREELEKLAERAQERTGIPVGAY
jgi:wyosine [tRNA(Phe)-imidazoG37] synthetase (radical SAM superfamily)